MDRQTGGTSIRCVSIEYPNSTNFGLSQTDALPPGLAERGWTLKKVGEMQCWVFDGRANIEEVRKKMDPVGVRPRRSCLAALMHGIKHVFDRH